MEGGQRTTTLCYSLSKNESRNKETKKKKMGTTKIAAAPFRLLSPLSEWVCVCVVEERGKAPQKNFLSSFSQSDSGDSPGLASRSMASNGSGGGEADLQNEIPAPAEFCRLSDFFFAHGQASKSLSI